MMHIVEFLSNLYRFARRSSMTSIFASNVTVMPTSTQMIGLQCFANIHTFWYGQNVMTIIGQPKQWLWPQFRMKIEFMFSILAVADDVHMLNQLNASCIQQYTQMAYNFIKLMTNIKRQIRSVALPKRNSSKHRLISPFNYQKKIVSNRIWTNTAKILLNVLVCSVMLASVYFWSHSV